MPVAAAPLDCLFGVFPKNTASGCGVQEFRRETSPRDQTVQTGIDQAPQAPRQKNTSNLHLRQKSTRAQTFGTIVKVAIATVLLSAPILTGCGGSQFAPTPTCASTSFDNRTNGGATDAQLQALWRQAQQQLATQNIPLNPVTALTQGAAPQTLSPDSRANGVQPQCIAVIAVPDLTVAQLQAENPGVTLQHDTDPTGVIHCPEGAQAKYCCAFTSSNNAGIYVAASQVLNGGATGWEFENIILARLGYNTAGR